LGTSEQPTHPDRLQGYRPQLDSLRAFAVAAVLAHHFWFQDLELSTLGVRLFFVLSGFLLTSILLRERGAADRQHIPQRLVLRDFYVRRILRIWPAYYFALAAAVALGGDSIARTFGWHAFFASNLLFFREQQWFPQVTAHLWTLSVEEQFYLVLPLVVLFVPRRLLAPILIACIAASIAFRIVVAATVTGSTDFYVVLPISELDALCGGALLGLTQYLAGPIDWKKLLAWSLIPTAILYFGSWSPAVDFALGYPAYVVTMASLVAGAAAGMGGWAGRVLSAGPIVYLGRISYGVYLYHLFVAAGCDKATEMLGYQPLPDGPVRFIVFFSVTIVVAAASWQWLERPALSLRRRFRRATIAEAVVPAAPA
jgi:peptidoglycan/LPS O-acetylase OafA/YrhL